MVPKGMVIKPSVFSLEDMGLVETGMLELVTTEICSDGRVMRLDMFNVEPSSKLLSGKVGDLLFFDLPVTCFSISRPLRSRSFTTAMHWYSAGKFETEITESKS